MEYWNSTVDQTGTGRPVDAVISPVAPFPAAIRNKYGYYGKQTQLVVLVIEIYCILRTQETEADLSPRLYQLG